MRMYDGGTQVSLEVKEGFLEERFLSIGLKDEFTSERWGCN